MRIRTRRFLVRAGLGLLTVAVLVQLVPYGRDHTNPPVTQDAPWPEGRARELATAACYDCHSNQTRWPPQSHVAPFSWLLTRDVEQGRDELNFSTWDEDDGEADDAADAVAEGSMPPRRYVLVHPDAAVSEAERQLLVDALEAMDGPAAAGTATTAARGAAASPGGQLRGRKPARKVWTSSWEAAQRSAGAWNSTAWRCSPMRKVMS
jgi:hypothetical protein